MAEVTERRENRQDAPRAGFSLNALIGASAAPLSGVANRVRAIALILSALWLVVVAAYALGLMLGPGPEETGRPITAIDISLLFLAILAPVTLTVFGLAASSALQRLTEEADAARSELAKLRQAGGLRPARGPEAEVKKLLNEMRAERAALAEVLREAAARARSGELGQARPAPAARPEVADPAPSETPRDAAKDLQAKSPDRPVTKPAPEARSSAAISDTPEENAEPQLPLDPPPEDARPAMDWDALVVAMEFPNSETDRTAIEALYKVLPDPMAARLMQSAEDAMTILAAEGLYMDEMRASSTDENDWTRYLDGARGVAASAIGAIADEEVVEKTRARLSRDRVFNDTALHFLLRYDALVKRARQETGGDAYAPRMAATRTGKAYALLTRALGRFDR